MEYMKVYHIILICLLYWPERVHPFYYPTVYWSPNNCRFNLNKPEQPLKFFFKIKPGSHLFFVCPHVAIWRDMGNKSPHHGRMHENLWLVDKQGFDTCTVNKTRNPKLNREILKCDKSPMDFKYTEEIVAPHRAFPDKMRYTLGNYYYFISTSDGTIESLANTAGGHCKSHHMKLEIYLCRKDEPCDFEMPKCPFTDVFHHKTKQTTQPATTTWPTTTSSPSNSTLLPTTRIVKQIVNQKTNAPKPTPTTEAPSALVDARKQSSPPTLWGKDRTHIIVHITMSLFILILLLCLIYIWISRRKPFLDSKKSKGIDSELYRQRPISVQQPTENEPFSGQTLVRV